MAIRTAIVLGSGRGVLDKGMLERSRQNVPIFIAVVVIIVFAAVVAAAMTAFENVHLGRETRGTPGDDVMAQNAVGIVGVSCCRGGKADDRGKPQFRGETTVEHD